MSDTSRPQGALSAPHVREGPCLVQSQMLVSSQGLRLPNGRVFLPRMNNGTRLYADLCLARGCTEYTRRLEVACDSGSGSPARQTNRPDFNPVPKTCINCCYARRTEDVPRTCMQTGANHTTANGSTSPSPKGNLGKYMEVSGVRSPSVLRIDGLILVLVLASSVLYEGTSAVRRCA